jgi:hypothetical protein
MKEAVMNKRDFLEIMQHTHAPLEKMLEMVPETKLSWAPAPRFMSLGQLIKHIGENWCLIKMMVTNEWPRISPEQEAEMMKPENLPSCSKQEAIAAATKDITEALAFVEREVTDEAFFNQAVSTPWGFKGEIWRGVLMAQEHFLNHKMQLHLYLKMCGAPVDTASLYGA